MGNNKCTDGKDHDLRDYTITMRDGSKKPMVKCTKCKQEWS